jgi:hypothetical protein
MLTACAVNTCTYACACVDSLSGRTMAVVCLPESDSAAQAGGRTPSQAFSNLTRELAHDFNNIWSSILGHTQEAFELPGFQDRDEVLRKIIAASSSGLLYSRSLMEMLARTESGPQAFDICDAIRSWSYRTSEIVGANLDISCLVPPQALHILFDLNALDLILLSFVGFALRSDTKRWAMVGVRSVSSLSLQQQDSPDGLDIMFLCRQDTGRNPLANFEKRVAAARVLVAPYGGVVETSLVAGVGVNARIRFPLAEFPHLSDSAATL